MSNKSSSSLEKSPHDRFKGNFGRNTLGMTQKKYDKYREKMVEEYINGNDTLNELTEREQNKGIMLYQDRLRRWVLKAGGTIRQVEDYKRIEGGTASKFLYLRKDQAELLEEFDSMSEIGRVAFDILFGIQTPNIVLFLGRKKSVIFMKRRKIIETYLTSDFTDMETKIIQTLTTKANTYGLHYVEQFAVENELTYYGGVSENE